MLLLSASEFRLSSITCDMRLASGLLFVRLCSWSWPSGGVCDVSCSLWPKSLLCAAKTKRLAPQRPNAALFLAFISPFLFYY
jgi:hypothetical protein